MNVKEIFVGYLILFSITITCYANRQKRKFDLLSIGDCDLPKEVFEPRPIKHATRLAIVRGKQTFQFNFTVTEKSLPVSNSIRVYKIIQNKRKLDFKIANLTCHNPVISVAWKKIHLKFDQNCCLLPGIFTTNYVKMEELLTAEKLGDANIGLRYYDMEFHTRRGIVFCISMGIDIL